MNSRPAPADALAGFHPAVAGWFRKRFAAPTAAQAAAWPLIRSGRSTLVAAPTGSGKTLTAFLSAIDELVREGLANATQPSVKAVPPAAKAAQRPTKTASAKPTDPAATPDAADNPAAAALPDATLVVYVSPLKALSNDIRLNLEAPLAGIADELAQRGLPPVEIRTAVRTGDTSQQERTAVRKRAPHILVTTPESLYVLLGSASGRAMLSTVRTVIVDEIHALAGNKRGCHLALSLERLDALCGRPLPRIGLSATQKPITTVARFLVGSAAAAGHVAEAGSKTERDASLDTSRNTSRDTSLNASLNTSVNAPAPRRADRTARTIRRGAKADPSTTADLPLDPEGHPIDCAIVDVGHVRERDLAIEIPPEPLEAVMANDVWERVYDRLAELVAQHRTTLVFVNTRRMAERVARHLTDRLGKEAVAAHHGSLAKEHRFDAEQRLKAGALRVLVATASLELGIDIGDVDLVCQIGSPRTIAAFLQRVGRSGHQVGAVPKGRLFPTSRDDLIECAAILDCVRRNELDRLVMPHAPLDVLAQQIVAEVAAAEWNEDALFERLRHAAPYATLTREQYDAVLRMLAEGYTGRHGVRGAWLHRDAVSRTLRGRRGSRLVALTSGGTIPDNADYAVLLEPQGVNIGTVNEDFAVESLAGDVFQLGNASYRILRVEAGRVRVEDAQGQPPNIPFWLGEAPGRSDELSAAVARLREEVEHRLAAAEPHAEGDESDEVDEGADGSERANDAHADHRATALAPAIGWLVSTLGLNEGAARQIVEYLARARAALTVLPTQHTLVMERFFDESGGMQLVIHAPFGSRINRAWGLALRKRFCRSFNFELQAAATEDAIILSLTGSHSFVLDEVWRYLRSTSAEHILIQALLDAPLFGVRWRWNATTSLALPRQTGGGKTPTPIQRMRSEDLLAAVFPDQVACLENIVGERELPDHPLVNQTVDDCLHDAMDTDGWLRLLRRIEAGEVKLVARDLPAPSPLAAEILSARPYAFLDDAPLEERRTQAVLSRRWTDPESADDLGALDADAIRSVAAEAWPLVRNADEMHEALMSLACINEREAGQCDGWSACLAALAGAGRATRMKVALGDALWVPVERLTCLEALYPQAPCEPALRPPAGHDAPWHEEDALVEVIRARLTGFGPQPVPVIARSLALPASAVALALTKLEAEGYVMRGRFTPGALEDEWCERHLLARIHRYTVRRLRREIEPVQRHDFMRFLFEWQHVSPSTRVEGRDALAAVLDQFEGWEAAAGAWEEDILPARVKDYSITWLDELCRAGKVVWARLGARARTAAGPVRATPVVLLPRRHLQHWQTLVGEADGELSARAQRVHDLLAQHGAMFFDELAQHAHLLPVELENALGELVAAGLANADGFAGLRALIKPVAKRNAYYGSRRPRGAGALIGGMEDAGRWALLRRPAASTAATAATAQSESTDSATLARKPQTEPEVLEHVAITLLRRYGVVFWQLLAREAPWLPPWRDLLRVLHRMEARGHVRGGRFIEGLSGEQFALPEAIPLLREVRRHADDGVLVSIAATDPLNLVGTVLAGEKVPAVAGNRVLFRDGVPVATLVAGSFDYLGDFDPTTKNQMRMRLAQRY
ncbi:DEAD/DEAH box helicase [Paraburkholderia kururiensis]|uniref:DEAD/DEAH box helicase n=1 Tax=Paraburkholderia kururiensis TaxID=984307 RepID=A0ABZ0WQK5_9BURK|nr:DEAD/DEAH box helicase [Paraburkholderia kururiensis]WQD79655.1 DEAD/DEAH box helicase [Paraburkholderia kururiensis]